MLHICMTQKFPGISSVLLRTWEKRGLSNSFTHVATQTLHLDILLVRAPNIHKHSLVVLSGKQFQDLFLGR